MESSSSRGQGTGTDLSGDSDRNRGQGCIYALHYLMMQMNMQDCLQSQTQPPALKQIDLATQPQNITSAISVLIGKVLSPALLPTVLVCSLFPRG